MDGTSIPVTPSSSAGSCVSRTPDLFMSQHTGDDNYKLVDINWTSVTV